MDSWTATVSEDASEWLSVSPASGSAGECALTISCSWQATTSERSGEITVSSGTKSFTLTVTQAAIDENFDIFTAMEDETFKTFCKQYDTDNDGKLSPRR